MTFPRGHMHRVLCLVTIMTAGRAQGKPMTMQHAKGEFQVKVVPVEPTPFEKAHGFARSTMEKTWTGDLSGTSHGQMFGANEDAAGAMGYTAMEKFEGTLAGKHGTFFSNTQRT